MGARFCPRPEGAVHQIAESANDVGLTERTDRFLIAGKWIELPVMDAIELRDGKICAWRDCFDTAQFQRQMAPDEGAA